uniref:Ribosomal protein S6 kinase related b n=1 Tax=Scleropages formosus TaxID=113540 RepID=A0A8C9W9R1_SCLFO
MGSDASKNCKKQSTTGDKRCPSRWRGLFSGMGISLPSVLSNLHLRGRRMVRDKGSSGQHHPAPCFPEWPSMEWTLPAFISMFLPEFPHRNVPGHEQFQVLGYIAKGSFGPILKVKDKSKEKTYAVKVVPKSEVLRLGILEQSKEEVIIQRQVRHPFVHDLQDCWQTQRHLFIMSLKKDAGSICLILCCYPTIPTLSIVTTDPTPLPPPELDQ